jgi:hypothetical protein
MRELNPAARPDLLVVAALPAHYQRDVPWTAKGAVSAAARRTIVSPSAMTINIGQRGYRLGSGVELDLAAAASWDDLTTDWTAAANRAGRDFYLYACQQPGSRPRILCSANATVPVGHNAETARKVGGFHCLCAAAGEIAGHPMSGYLAGDIVPASVWDLRHRPVCSPEGMVYDPLSAIWVDIYLMSGTGPASASACGATITVNRTWLDLVDDLAAAGKRLPTDSEFQIFAAGSNERTNIAGSVSPGITGGYLDTAGRRMISHIGVESACGVVYQWLQDQSFQVSGLPDTGDPGFSWYTLPGSKGSLYRQGSSGDVKLRAGGGWSAGANCGSRARSAGSTRWHSSSSSGCRGCARSLNA